MAWEQQMSFIQLAVAPSNRPGKDVRSVGIMISNDNNHNAFQLMLS